MDVADAVVSELPGYTGKMRAVLIVRGAASLIHLSTEISYHSETALRKSLQPVVVDRFKLMEPLVRFLERFSGCCLAIDWSASARSIEH